MKKSLVIGFAAVLVAGLATGALAASAKSYQVTGPVVEVTDTKIIVQKGEGEKSEKWELNRTAETKGAEALKVGEKVTVKYTMTAVAVEGKTAAKEEAKAEKAVEKKAEKKGKK